MEASSKAKIATVPKDGSSFISSKTFLGQPLNVSADYCFREGA